jgi:putative hydrolase
MGHNFRLGLEADWPRVFALAAQLDKAVEVDCYPDRQDLNVDLLRLAKREGCRVSLGTDSHGPSQLAFMDLGIAAIALAGIDPKRVMNFLPLDELLEWAGTRKSSRAI